MPETFYLINHYDINIQFYKNTKLVDNVHYLITRDYHAR